ncbi:hypothetical protein MPTK1_6g07750 [Marchantia polymorpha subsp. ruderalis]|uniref:Metallo-beta-lactamase domain-containing protein n=2 Tax=Marchantia polymorpha TaxID=3197 RepID=A0A176W220_MARPO|nr:hypothetical protein AXG93_4542s1120 [Marchantia polymorpha subsp. ruderalis]PTQ38164.1 hypothetical protein MARPO_0053s0088 [Marchantia polymorpha]BBN13963.1 hypothetical protein Mp_6g07750 [Marchantia polymorpha subsp. ruderalis]|eukprot:PTQ38164.1 hypothetical protein MARPO_0053s0088 [Marchantia polymorpha]
MAAAAAALQSTAAVCSAARPLLSDSRARQNFSSTRRVTCTSSSGLKLGSSQPTSERSRDEPSLCLSRASTSASGRLKVSAVKGSEEFVVQTTEMTTSPGASPLSMTYLEGNSWLWEILGLKVLIDPVLVGNLDFGIPLLYDAAKKSLREFKLEDLPELDCLLICQGYDDHCHEKTLEPLSQLKPNLRVISSPNAEPILSKYFKNVTYLEPKTGESTTLKASNGSVVRIRASPGPILGPPWQRPESGYFIEVEEPKFSIYYEPHCIFENASLEGQSADVLVTPVIQQVLPGYVLVSGQEDAVKVAEYLKPKFVVTMKNGDLDSKGLLSMIVRQKGTNETFQELLFKKLPNTEVLNPSPGVPMVIPIKS